VTLGGGKEGMKLRHCPIMADRYIMLFKFVYTEVKMNKGRILFYVQRKFFSLKVFKVLTEG